MSSLAARPFRVFIALVLLAALAVGAWQWTARSAEPASKTERALRDAGIDAKERAAFEALVRDYILEHPEILPEAIERLRQREVVAQLDTMRQELFTPYDGAVLGNPTGSKTLIEFTDYACGYCRQSWADVEALIAADPDLKVVIRELPILSEGSGEAALMALAAARQGKYAQFHEAMFAAGKPTEENIAQAARSAGLDLARARRDMRDPALSAEIAANRQRAAALQVSGTPAWVTEDRLLSGAVGIEALREALYEQAG